MPYEYNALVIDTYDSDTVTLNVDLGFDIHYEVRCRLSGIDGPEIRTRNLKEKEFGFEARDYLRERILNKKVILKSLGNCKFGRVLGEIYLEEPDGSIVYINQELIDVGYAKPYSGGKRPVWEFD